MKIDLIEDDEGNNEDLDENMEDGNVLEEEAGFEEDQEIHTR